MLCFLNGLYISLIFNSDNALNRTHAVPYNQTSLYPVKLNVYNFDNLFHLPILHVTE